MIAVARPQGPPDRSGPPRPGIRPVTGEPLDRSRQLGIQVERVLEVPDRLHGAPLGLEDHREVVVGLRQFRGHGEGGPEPHLGLLVLAAEVKFHRAAEGLQKISR